MFFAVSGVYPACGMFSPAHLIALAADITVLVVGLILTRKMPKRVMKIVVKAIAVTVVSLEIIKICFWAWREGLSFGNVYRWLPLYYCSMFLYASMFAAFGKGRLQRIGHSYMFWGGAFAALAFLVFPVTSLNEYPIFHFISFHSMFYHMVMVYTGIGIVVTGLYRPNLSDFKYYSVLVVAVIVAASAVNVAFNANMLFLREPAKLVIFTAIHKFSPVLYTLMILFGQNFGPFAATALILLAVEKIRHKKTGILVRDRDLASEAEIADAEAAEVVADAVSVNPRK